ncbi:MAG TPA: N-acetylmuramoyl-L-alanine amidase [Rubricoccaceae bacterium]|nr:N-acetylmuramoyl-L-alanine amidase [Rubricoccaceae bacterium]
MIAPPSLRYPARRAALAVALLVLAGAARADAGIERVSFAARADGRGYVVRLHMDGRAGAYSVEQPSPGTLTLVVYRAHVAPALRRDEARGPVRAYQIVPADDRVTLRLTLVSGVAVQAQAYPDRDSDDLLLSLTTGTAPVATRPAGGSTHAASSPAPAGGTRPDAASGEHWRLNTIVIDAGHGGHDAGAVAHGVREKDVTLAVARRLGRYIEERLGVRVVYTRTDDRFITLDGRGRAANAAGGKLFISIHANAAAASSARGTETYFLARHRDESARQVMERENAVVRMESDPSLYDDFDAEGGILRTLALSAYAEESQSLASLIEGQFRTRRSSRGVKQAGFLVLWRASMPAVLVELGFLTNPEEARFLASADGQDQLALSIFRAVQAYKEQYERGLRLASN